jgi:hypothetical protein
MPAPKSLVATAYLVAWLAGIGVVAAKSPSKRLVFEGTVTSITLGADELEPWIVTVMVEKVITGDFSGPMFQFTVHSPARAGLAAGDSYTIEAVWRGKGYATQRWKRSPATTSDCTNRLGNKVLQAHQPLARFAPLVARL